MNVAKLAPRVAGVLALAGCLYAALPAGLLRGYDVAGFGQLPVLEGGRVKPIDSIARNSLLVIRGQQTFRYQGKAVGPDEWLLDVMFAPDVADDHPIFVINDPDVLGFIDIQQTADRYYSFKTLEPHIADIEKQAELARSIDPKQRTRFQSAIANLFDRLYQYHRLRNTVQLARTPGLATEIANRAAPGAEQRLAALTELAVFRPLPPAAGQPPEAWLNVGEALTAAGAGPPDPSLLVWSRLAQAHAAKAPADFNTAVSELAAIARAQSPAAAGQVSAEVVFNRAQPFYAGMIIYVLALICVFASWVWKPTILQPTAFALLVAGSVVHTAGLISRVILQGRPPVTNLYSSAVFVGWGAVILGIILERMYRRGYGTVVAAASGFASLIVAHHLASDGDTMEMMRAVLDSNFWLATHVVTITIGYSGTFLAGAIAIVWVVRRHFAKALDPATSKALASMTYGIICFALFFSFIGTVLGGIWADQSWGRFWGWDPKENGALLIVLWCAIILHARWGGYAKERGIMAMAIFGNVITSFSWFGVNMLGVGLHAYGFMDEAFWALAWFMVSQLVLVGFALLPPKFWRPAPAKAPEPEPAKA
ncbi:MAG: cytochrome c assembly protein [Myxococcaceae bacterium]|nr:cytochrome c assembly protein [Myxococcaceae bacterium]